ncbi:MAG TPA: DUF2997 domain-containing protein [Pirellulales bacterium]|nr:DUF2997 domain-containing protein [Pirellulales bacterium]
MKTIEITVAADGSTRIETRGFSGTSCQEASKFLERALGRTTHETLTAEYHAAQTTQAADQRQTI